MRVALCLALMILHQNPSSQTRIPDLEPMLQNDEALRRLLIVYWPPAQKGWQQAFFVRGDGSVVKQATPERPMAVTDIPTCTEQIGSEKVKALVRLIIQKHFFELPERHFIFIYAAQMNEELEMHTIGISDGQAKAPRSFGIGKYAGKDEVIPPEFAAIEAELKQIRDSAFPPHGKDCHFSPPISF
jgi:hypothetical protein